MRSVSTFIVAAVALMLVQTGHAQLFGGGGDKASAEFVPGNAFAGGALFPKKITDNPDFKLFPHEIITAWGKKEIGFDPMLIKQVTWIVETPKEFGQQQLGWAAVLHFEEMQGLAGNMIDQLKEKKIAGKTVYSGAEQHMPSFLVFDESTMIVGEEAFFESLMTADGNGKVVELFKQSSVAGQILAYVDIQAVRPVIDEIVKYMDKFEVPPAVDNLRLIPELVNSVELGLNTDATLEMTLVAHATNSETAEQVNDILIEGMLFAKTALLTQMANEMDLNDPVQAATLQYTQRMAEKYETKLAPVVSGADLTIKLQEELLLVPMLLSGVGSMQSAMDFEMKMSPEVQLRQTALAFHNYESAYQKFPKRVIKDENGKPLFSGRVAILPFIEQNALYGNLRMDEPWNSSHNSKFTSMLVPAYVLIGGDGTTSAIRFPVFPNSLWDDDDKDLGFRDITDGTSNTIFAIHAPADDVVEWANPAPWNISATNPMADVFGDRDEVTVAMLDGSTRVLEKSKMTNEKLKAMLTISGGEVVRD